MVDPRHALAPRSSDAQIAHDLGMDDRERDAKLAGQTSAAFFLVGAPASVVAGYIDPYVNRVAALLSVVILGEGPLVLTLFVTRFWQLFLLRRVGRLY